MTTTATQVTAAANGQLSEGGIALQVMVLDAAALAATPSKGYTYSGDNIGTPETSITVSKAQSVVYGATWISGAATATAASGTTFISKYEDTYGGGGFAVGVFFEAGPTGGPGPVTVGASGPEEYSVGVACLEVLANPSVSTDSSTPAVVGSEWGTSVTTSLFTPPAGALLVALVATANDSVSLTDSSGLTWTEEVNDAQSDTIQIDGGYAGVWTASLGGGENATGQAYLVGSYGQAAGGSAAPSIPTSYPAGLGDVVIVACFANNSATVTGVTDSRGNIYTLVGSIVTATTCEIFVFAAYGSGGLTLTDTVHPVYSSTASAQAVLVIGDNGTGQKDKFVVATGSGTTPSVSTGTLTTTGEHVIAFFANLNGGGAPVLGDSLAQIATVNAGPGGPYLTAGYKTTTSTSAQTPSAAIASATWSIAVITDEVAGIYITTTPGNGIQGSPYSTAFTATGGSGTYTWTYSGTLPTGLTLSTGGVLSGTPSVIGTFGFTVTATDTLSNTATDAFNVSVSGLTVAVAPPLYLPSNLLGVSDSDFEMGAWTWSAFFNASAPVQAHVTSVTGAHSLSWVAGSYTDSPTELATGYYPCEPGLPYICSGYIQPAQSGYVSYIGFQWFTSSYTPIGVVYGVGNAAGVFTPWSPVCCSAAAPSNAAYFSVVAQVGTANPGDTEYIDLMYAAQTNVQVLVDWVNPVFAQGSIAGQDFADVSMFVRMDNGITMSRGRQDAISEMQAGSGSFELQNDTGSFTTRSNTSYIYGIGGTIDLQKRVQINIADQNGSWWTRFDGLISEIDYSGDDTGLTNTAAITTTDVLAPLSREDELGCWTRQQVLSNKPALMWMMDDNWGGNLSYTEQQDGSGITADFGMASESSGNNGPPMRLWNSDGTNKATLAWQDTSGGIETLADAIGPALPDGSVYWVAGSNQPSSLVRGLVSGTVGPFTSPPGSVLFTPTVTAQTGPNMWVGNTGYSFTVLLPFVVAPITSGVNYSFELWFTMDISVETTNKTADVGPYCFMGLGSSRTRRNLACAVLVDQTQYSSDLGCEVQYLAQDPGFIGQNFTGTTPTVISSVNTQMHGDLWVLPHHFVMTITGDPHAATVAAYLDSVPFASGTISLAAKEVFDTLTVGSAFGTTGSWFGNIQIVSVYDFALSQNQITQDCMMGQYGMWEQTADNTVAALASFSNIPQFWNNLNSGNTGLTLMDYLDITGSNALASMQTYEQAERGLLHVGADGRLTFHTRDWRMGYPGPDLYLPPDTFDASMGFELVDQFQQNEMSVTSAIFTGTGTDYAGTSPLEVIGSSGAGSYVNTTSQEQYGTYATNAIGSPLSLPLIAWSRAYGQLGLPSYYYWSDPYLNDYAAWNANAYATPWLLPGQLSIDVLQPDTSAGNVTPFVFGSVGAASGSSSYPVNVEETTSVGDTLLVAVTIASSAVTVTGVSDSQQNNYVLVKSAVSTGNGVYVFATTAATQLTESLDTVTVSVSGSSVGVNITCADLPSVATLDTAIAASGTSGTTQSAATGALAHAGETVLAFGVVASSAPAWQAPMTQLALSGSAAGYATSGYAVAATTASVTAATATGTSSPDWALVVLSLHSTPPPQLSDYYAIGIDNMLAPSGILPASFPNQALSTQWFIEGETETITQSSHTLQYYTSAAENQRAWRPGDPTYGALGVSTQIGISASDTHAIAADAKDVSHDAGPPYWPPTFSASLNNPSANGHGFVGGLEMRGLVEPLTDLLNPPILVVSAVGQTQTFNSGDSSDPAILWDTIHVDTINGMGAVPGWPNWYCCLKPGFYDIDCCAVASSDPDDEAIWQVWIAIAMAGAQWVTITAGTPVTNGQYTCPIGMSVQNIEVSSSSASAIGNPSTRIYLGLGDMVAMCTENNAGDTLMSGNIQGGSHMSLIYRGIAETDDRCQINTDIYAGGSVSNTSPRAPYTGQVTSTPTYTYGNTASYAYYGAQESYGLRYSNSIALQGEDPNFNKGGCCISQIAFDVSQMQTDANGQTPVSAVLTCTNTHSFFSTGTYLQLGVYFDSSGGSSWHPTSSSNSISDIAEFPFPENQTMELTLPITLVNYLLTGNAQGLKVGDGVNFLSTFYSTWDGSVGSWELGLTYSSTVTVL